MANNKNRRENTMENTSSNTKIVIADPNKEFRKQCASEMRKFDTVYSPKQAMPRRRSERSYGSSRT